MEAISMKVKLWLAAAAAFSVLAFAGSVGSAAAQASTSPYCGTTLPGYGNCTGAIRTLYQVYGWGDQHSVCVAITGHPGAPGIGYTCSSGPGVGVYSPSWEPTYIYPFIANNAAGSNSVHGVALQP